MDGKEVPVSLALLRIISAPGRLRLLRSLRQRRKTATELSDEVGWPKSSAHAHVAALHRAGLLTRHAGDNLWIYYGLKAQGRRLAEPERPKLLLVPDSLDDASL